MQKFIAEKSYYFFAKKDEKDLDQVEFDLINGEAIGEERLNCLLKKIFRHLMLTFLRPWKGIT